MTEPWLTKRELAQELKVSVRTVERLRLPAMRVGGQNRYRLSEVEDYVRAYEVPARVGNPRTRDMSTRENNVVRFPRPRVPA